MMINSSVAAYVATESVTGGSTPKCGRSHDLIYRRAPPGPEKSTLVQSAGVAGQGRQYLTFDDPGILAAAKRDPNGFVAGLDAPVTLDEIQHVPELFSVIKAAIDRNRQPGRFLLTGSANVMLLPKLSESLAGRMADGTVFVKGHDQIRISSEGKIVNLITFAPSVSEP